ncbi:DciA family protein [Celerinatantimonas sp. MCCC 1A17872]|uniref:DciA family protein n=1 Tax=Celerinatantimonas sp. MCCC 1A17872 TaxID=3177514 RepID=UPI0038C73B1B
MAKRVHQPIDIDHLFSRGPLAQIRQNSEQREKLTKSTQHILHQYHLDNCQLTHLENSKAVISAPNAAWMTRLRQLKSQLLSELRKAHPSLISLEIKVNPNLASIKPEAAVKITKSRQISPQSAQNIRDSAKHLPDELKERLERIAALCGEKK